MYIALPQNMPSMDFASIHMNLDCCRPSNKSLHEALAHMMYYSKASLNWLNNSTDCLSCWKQVLLFNHLKHSEKLRTSKEEQGRILCWSFSHLNCMQTCLLGTSAELHHIQASPKYWLLFFSLSKDFILHVCLRSKYMKYNAKCVQDWCTLWNETCVD